MKTPVPSTVNKSQVTMLVWDKIDFIEETVSGSNTTQCEWHCSPVLRTDSTSPFQITRKTLIPHHLRSFRVQLGNPVQWKSRKRKLELSLSETKNVHYPKRQRTDPQLQGDAPVYKTAEEARQAGVKLDQLYFFFLKFMQPENPEHIPLPLWTGFNAAVQKEIPALLLLIYQLLMAMPRTYPQ